MAAHVKTALEQIKASQYPSSHINGALEISSWTEELTLTEYCEFDDIVNSIELTTRQRDAQCKLLAAILLHKYTQLWHDLGEPETREAWHKARFNS